MRTSITDGIQGYKNVCLNASKDDEIFNSFKQDGTYREVLEHTSVEYGQEYINFILTTKLNLNKIDKFKENDEQGSATIVDYSEPFGKISPSTLRYVKVLSEIEKIFGSLDNKKIIEIGVGYGGQSKIIMDYFNVKEYAFVDILEPLELTKRYLKKYNYKNTKFYTADELPDEEYDIVISNYAFSECNRDVQKFYIDKILNKSKCGYITSNYTGHFFNVPMMTKEEIKDSVEGSYIIDEIPLTAPNNYILLWDRR